MISILKQPKEGAPLQAAPLQAAPLQAAPLQATPLQAAPLQATPLQAAPLQATPLQATPLQATPLQAAPLQATPLQAAPLQATPLQAAPLQAAPLQATPLQAAPLQAAPRGAAPLQATPLQVTPGNVRVRVQKPEHTGSRCSVYGCFNRSGLDKANGVKRSYHVLPKDTKRRALWVKAVPRSNWIPGKNDFVCSDHFIGGKPSRSEGSPSYVPSLFPTKATNTPRTTATAKRTAQDVPPALPTATRARPAKKVEERQEPGRKSIDHDYLETRRCDKPVDPEVVELRWEVAILKSLNADLESRMVSLEQIKLNPQEFQFYTGFPSYDNFKALFDYLMRRSEGQLRYWRGEQTDLYNHFSEGTGMRPGPARKLDLQHEFFLVLVRLKTGKFYIELARQMNISMSLVSQIYTTWINFLAIELKLLFEMKFNLDDPDMIAPCYHRYPSLKVVIDCTELIAEKSSRLQARKETFSNYKSRDTVKFMVGLSPNLTVNYVSFAYGGRASDKYITLESASLLDKLPRGSQVMADRGFRVEQELGDMGVELIIPDFKGSDRSQMTTTEVQNSEEIAMARIHIERIIQRIRIYHILDSNVKLSQKDVVEQTFTVCAYLVNFQTPIKNTSGSSLSKALNLHLNGVHEAMDTQPASTSSVLDILEPL